MGAAMNDLTSYFNTLEDAINAVTHAVWFVFWALQVVTIVEVARLVIAFRESRLNAETNKLHSCVFSTSQEKE